jgi:hypothetical protein
MPNRFHQTPMINVVEGNSHTLPITRPFRNGSPSLAHITHLKVSASQYTGGFIGKIVRTCS